MAKKITKQINSKYNPTLMSSYPEMYGFGSWLENNAGTIGTVAGAGLGALVGMPGLGATVGGQLGGTVQQGVQSKELEQQQQMDFIKKDKISNLPAQHFYQPTFANGGLMNSYADGGGLSRSEDYGSKKKPYPSVPSGDFAGGGRSYPIPTKADAVDALRLAGLHGRSDVRAKVYAKYPGLKKADGGEIEPNDIGVDLPITDRLTEFKNGGTHEQSPTGGVPIGENALVEQDEFMYKTKAGKKYIFSNRF